MKKCLLILIIIAFGFPACRNSRKENDKAAESPKALEDKSSYKLVSKRNNENIVEILYEELVEKTPELKAFESSFSTLQESQSDSLNGFNKFNSKNNNYYNSANGLIANMNDSVLKNKIRLLIQNSETQYNSSISMHSTLVDKINLKNASLNDLHTSLKIIRTLPLIQQYQLDKKPSTKALEGLSNEMEKVKAIVDSLLKKQ